jgi:hypothetical protein
VAASTSQVDQKSGLFVVKHAADWARGGQGGENCPANMLYYRVLIAGTELATMVEDQATAQAYSAMAKKLRAAIQENLWDDTKGAFYDNTNNHNMYPQDGNSLAIWFNITNSETQSKSVSDYLASNWGAFGSQSPEWHNKIGTFPGSMEVHAHMAAGQADRAHALIRLQWGYMLNYPFGTKSTFWEGYNADGSFAYQGIYMSNSHGWSTGPAAALTFGTLGIRHSSKHSPTNIWEMKPLFGNLIFCEGTLSLGNDVSLFASWRFSQRAIKHEQLGYVVIEIDSRKIPFDRTGHIEIDLHKLRSHDKLRYNSLLVEVDMNNVPVWDNNDGMLCDSEKNCSMILQNNSLEILSYHDTNIPSLLTISDVVSSQVFSLGFTFR